jgi:hypothetical protein
MKFDCVQNYLPNEATARIEPFSQTFSRKRMFMLADLLVAGSLPMFQLLVGQRI